MTEFSLEAALKIEKIRESLEEASREKDRVSKTCREINLLLGSFWVDVLSTYKEYDVKNQHKKIEVLAGLHRGELISGLDSLLNKGCTLKEVVDNLQPEERARVFELLVTFFKLKPFLYGGGPIPNTGYDLMLPY